MIFQLAAQYLALRAGPEKGLLPSVFHQQFPLDLEGKIQRIEDLRKWGFYGEQVVEQQELEQELLEGIHYYQRYQATVLTRLMQVGFKIEVETFVKLQSSLRPLTLGLSPTTS